MTKTVIMPELLITSPEKVDNGGTPNDYNGSVKGKRGQKCHGFQREIILSQEKIKSIISRKQRDFLWLFEKDG